MKALIIKFSKWKWKEKRKNVANNINLDERTDSFRISEENLKSYEENLKWESELVSTALHETRKRKYSAIKASIILFPGLIGGMLAAISYLEKSDSNTLSVADNWAGYYLVSIVSISMFIGMANMISIKYIAAYKAQANLFIRQLNCLRQARDSVTYYKFEGEFPINWRALFDKSGIYYKVFGKHRKLYIGNQEIRNRLIGSFSESADKSLISFLFLTSLTLISAPFIWLAAVSLKEWEKLSDHHLPFLDNPSYLISLNMIFIISAVIFFVVGHWENFRRLRAGGGGMDENEDEESRNTYTPLFILNKTDYVSVLFIIIIALYWMYLGFYASIFMLDSSETEFSIIMLTLSGLSLFLIIICVKKVFFDSLNRIYKSLVYKINGDLKANRHNETDIPN